MTILESLPVALFCLTMVFVVLACLFIIVRLFTVGIRTIESKSKRYIVAENKTNPTHTAQDNGDFSAGELKLFNVDERTAAMIMAIVSDESGIPLSELRFKCIRALE